MDMIYICIYIHIYIFIYLFICIYIYIHIKGVRKLLNTSTSSSSSALSVSAPKKTLGATTGSMAAKKAPITASSSVNDKEDDTVEDLALTLEDAIDALSALDIEGWDSSFQVSLFFLFFRFNKKKYTQ
jgi:hypothetical protein